MGHSIKAVLKAFDAEAERYSGFESSYRRIQEVREYMVSTLEQEEHSAAFIARKVAAGFERIGTALSRNKKVETLNKELKEIGYKAVPIENNIDDLVEHVRQWAINKSLDKAEPSKQMLKVVEETGEVAAALARGKRDDLRDGIGDVIVTLIILAEQNDMTIHECLEQAYSEIADRKGKMVDGVFVKDGD